MKKQHKHSWRYIEQPSNPRDIFYNIIKVCELCLNYKIITLERTNEHF